MRLREVRVSPGQQSEFPGLGRESLEDNSMSSLLAMTSFPFWVDDNKVLSTGETLCSLSSSLDAL